MRIRTYCLLAALVVIGQVNCVTFDLNQNDKNNKPMNQAPCNKDTVIDFSFSPQSTIGNCTSATCSTTNVGLSSLQYLDMSGSQQTYKLYQASVQRIGALNISSRQGESAFFKFSYISNSDSSKKLFLVIPFSDTHTQTNYTQALYKINLNNNGNTGLDTLKGITNLSSNSLPLSAFNVFNHMDLGLFYHLADPATQPKNTYLLSYFVFTNLKIDTTALPEYTNNIVPANVSYSGTGDKICYGSASQGIFQTHLRESFPLWTALIGIFFYWIFILLTEQNTINCYDKKFENNKWTCWGFYSLHHLGHEDYFTKLSRTTLMLITFSWEGCVIAILYSQVTTGRESIMILWAGIIGVVTALPFTHVMGYVFLRKIYQLTLQKYDVFKKMKDIVNKKDGLQTYEKQIDNIEESLYGYYYWFYVLAFCFFTAFWVIAVRQMMQINRDQFYFMHFWLASLGVALGFQHLFFDPLLTLLLGNTYFYRTRGFFYDFRLGERFKEIQD